jgi:hypothetical protein
LVLQPVEQAFAEAVLIEGLVPGPKLGFVIKLKEASPKKPFPNILCLELKLLSQDDAKRLWKVAETGVKAAPPAAFSFSEGAMMGPYELVEPRGGFLAGDHWRVKRPEGMGFLRLVPPGTGTDQDRAQRLVDRANSGVDAPDESILRIDDAGEEFNWLYLGTIGIDGKSLATRTARGALPEAEAIVLAKTIARALRVAHGFGVVHQGLSPLAVIYGTDGVPRVTDFGVGSVFFDGPSSGMAPGLKLGLLLYAAPELVRGGAQDRLDARADLYSLGALVLDAVSAVRNGDMKAPDGEPWLVQPRVSDGLLTILRRLLAADPDERYPSADHLLEDLEKVGAGGLPGPLPQPGPPLLVVDRPSTARPQQVVTAELLAAGEDDEGPTDLLPEPPKPQAAQPNPSKGKVNAAPPPEAEPVADYEPEGEAQEQPGEGQGDGDGETFELAPPTIDPDAEPPPPREEEEPGDDQGDGAVPATDDPDAAAAAPARKSKLGRRTTSHAMRAALESASDLEAAKATGGGFGVVPFVLSFVLVLGGWFAARAATAPDGATNAKIELARAHLVMDRDHDYRKAREHVAGARALSSDPALLEDARALELELARRSVAEYVEARKQGDFASAGARLLDRTDQACLRDYDQAKHDSLGDAHEWQKIGLALLRQGFATEGADALDRAGTKDSAYMKDRELGAGVAALGAFLPPGVYKGAKLTVAEPLYVGATEVTRADYARWFDDGTRSGTLHAHCNPKEPAGKNHAPDGWDPKVALAMKDRRPATGIDYWDAWAYAKAHGWRLATYEELLAAAGGPFGRSHPWGDRPFDAGLANAASAYKVLLPVGSFPAGVSPQGAFDLLGNAEEWTAAASDDAAETRIFGGSLDTEGAALTLEAAPTTAKLEERSPRRGFRCALTVSAKAP